jgi:hypothetical protein
MTVGGSTETSVSPTGRVAVSVTSCVPGPQAADRGEQRELGRVEAVEVRDRPADERDRVVRRETVVEPLPGRPT